MCNKLKCAPVFVNCGKFVDDIADPIYLPLLRGVFDHRIPLQLDAKHVNIRSYRYSLKHMDVIH